MKICPRCSVVKPESEWTYRASVCDECRQDQSRNYYHDHQDKKRYRKRIALQRFINWPIL